jgi:hypothetical protein
VCRLLAIFRKKKKAGAQEMFRPIRTGKIFGAMGKGAPIFPVLLLLIQLQ